MFFINRLWCLSLITIEYKMLIKIGNLETTNFEQKRMMAYL